MHAGDHQRLGRIPVLGSEGHTCRTYGAFGLIVGMHTDCNVGGWLRIQDNGKLSSPGGLGGSQTRGRLNRYPGRQEAAILKRLDRCQSPCDWRKPISTAELALAPRKIIEGAGDPFSQGRTPRADLLQEIPETQDHPRSSRCTSEFLFSNENSHQGCVLRE